MKPCLKRVLHFSQELCYRVHWHNLGEDLSERFCGKHVRSRPTGEGHWQGHDEMVETVKCNSLKCWKRACQERKLK